MDGNIPITCEDLQHLYIMFCLTVSTCTSGSDAKSNFRLPLKTHPRPLLLLGRMSTAYLPQKLTDSFLMVTGRV